MPFMKKSVEDPRCPYCNAQRGSNLYCWQCGKKLPKYSNSRKEEK